LKRGKKKSKEEYINIRIRQLQSDLLKASNKIDRQWYFKLIQELKWVLSYE